MGRAIICDVCRKPCQRIVLKLYLSAKGGPNGVDPARKDGRWTGDHSAYTAHADVGECCFVKVNSEMIRWTRRKKDQNKGPRKKASA